MSGCIVPLCDSKDGSTSFHAFPSDQEMKKKWILAVSREGRKPGTLWSPSVHSRICGKHFKESDFSVSTRKRILLPKVIPSIFPYTPVYYNLVHGLGHESQPDMHASGKVLVTSSTPPSSRTVEYEMNGLLNDYEVEEEYLCDDPCFNPSVEGEEVIENVPIVTSSRPCGFPTITLPSPGHTPKIITLPRVITLGEKRNFTPFESTSLRKYRVLLKKLIRRNNKQRRSISRLSARVKLLEWKLKWRKR